MLFLRQNILVTEKSSFDGGADDRKWYGATVLDLYDNEVLISLPKIKGEAMDLRVGSVLEISFVDRGSRYSFQSTVKQAFRQEAVVIDQPGHLDKIDLRQYPRAPVNLEALFTEVGSGATECKKGYIVDISGNGMRISTDQLYNPGVSLAVGFSLPAGEGSVPVAIEGRVVRVVVNDQSDPVEFHLGIKFSGVDSRRRDMIVGYVNSQLSRNKY